MRGETELFLLEEKMPKHELVLVRWFAGFVGFVAFALKHRLWHWSVCSVTGHV